MEWTPVGIQRGGAPLLRKDSVDKINQIFSFTFIYRTFRGTS